MVKKNHVEDDLDGSEAVGTTRFGLNGIDYEIDLNAVNAQGLVDALEKYKDAAREVGGDAQDLSRCEAAYQVLSDRISDNFDLQWRGPTFALTAQSFLFLGFLTAKSYSTIQLVMAFLIVIVGAAAALLMGYVQHLIIIDQKLLDKYGFIFLRKHPELQLLHSGPIKARAAGAEYEALRS
jgi:Lsr2